VVGVRGEPAARGDLGGGEAAAGVVLALDEHPAPALMHGHAGGDDRLAGLPLLPGRSPASCRPAGAPRRRVRRLTLLLQSRIESWADISIRPRTACTHHHLRRTMVVHVPSWPPPPFNFEHLETSNVPSAPSCVCPRTPVDARTCIYILASS
jgi:hypothetical protein